MKKIIILILAITLSGCGCNNGEYSECWFNDFDSNLIPSNEQSVTLNFINEISDEITCVSTRKEYEEWNV